MPTEHAPEHDWVQLTNGEWLMGELVTMRNDSIEFDSDEFGVQTLDWEDIAELHTAERVTLTRPDMTTRSDRISVVGETVTFHSTNETEYRAEYLSIVPNDENWWSLWSGSIGAGFTARRGNSRQTDTSLHFVAVHRTACNRLNAKFDHLVSETNDEETANNTKLTAGWDRFVSRSWFVTPFQYEFFQDRFQNIRQRHSPGFGGGYTIIDRPKFEWDITGGLGYRYTEYYSVSAGDDQTTENGFLVFGTTISGDITSTTEFDILYNITQGLITPTMLPNHFKRP